MKKIYKSPAIEAVEIEINSIMQTRSGASPESSNSTVGSGGAGIGDGGGTGDRFEAGRNRGFGNLWGDN